MNIATYFAEKLAEEYIRDFTWDSIKNIKFAEGHNLITMPYKVKPKKRRTKRVSFKKALGYQSGRSISKIPPVELKAYDVASAALDFISPGTGTSIAAPLNLPVNGAEIFQRVGRKIYMKSIQIKGWIYNKGTAIQDVGRILLVYDSQTNGAAPLIQNIINNMDGTYATDGLSMVNLNNRQRFQIIRDHQITLPADTYTAGVLTNGPSFNMTNAQAYCINWYIPLKKLETVYNQLNTGNVSDIVSGALWILCVSEADSHHWTFTFNTRLRFYD